MRRIALGFVFAAVFLCQQATAIASSKVFAWEVTKGSKILYLVGSIHMANESLYPLDPALTNAFDKSDTLVVEADVTSAEASGGLMMIMIEKGMYPPEESLATKLSPETYQALQNYAVSRGINLAMFQQLKPWAISMTLSVTELMRYGFSPEHGIDYYFLTKAKESGKTIKELESTAAQIELLASWSDDEQDLFLASALEEMGRIKDMMDTTIEAWRNGDHDAIDKIAVAEIRNSTEYRFIYEKMISNRNVAMTEKIKGYFKTRGIYFVIAGAAHMVGEDGIVALLENAGYDVKQIDAVN